MLMVSGSDSHGAPVVFKAEEEKVTPKELSDKYHKEIVDLFDKLGLVYENYTTTTTENHKDVVQNVFKVLMELGYLEIKKSKQYYDPKVKRYLPDRYVKGTCPECGVDNARGDECPECGAYLEPEQLIAPYSTLSDAKPELKEVEHFYLNLKKVEKKLGPWVDKASPRWRKWVRSFSKGWIKGGLKPRSVSRDMEWGIPVPVEGWEDKVIYVWIEAVVGYLSAAIEWAEKQGNPSEWEDFWKDPEVEHYYFIAGGNVPFHTIIWPAEIMAYNEKYEDKTLAAKYWLPGEKSDKPLNLPFDVPANKMLFFKGKKMSKGDNTGLTVNDLVENYSPDLIRYFFTRYAPENNDREYTWKDFIDANNQELVANIGNFINRSLTFTHSKFDGVVPKGELDIDVKKAIDKAFKKAIVHIEKAEFVKSTEAILELGHFANKFFNDQEPWATVKEEIEKAENTVYNSVQIVNALRILLKPLLPFSTDKLIKILNLDEEYDPTAAVKENGRAGESVDQYRFELIEAGHKLNAVEILYEKLEYTDELREVDEAINAEGKREVDFAQAKELEKDIPVISKMYNGVSIKRKRSNVSAWVKKLENKIDKKYGPKYAKKKEFEGFRELHGRYSEMGFTPSSENLVAFVKEKGSLPNINTFVDIYNAVSAYTGVSIGAHDVAKLQGDAKLSILDDDVKFITISEGEPSTARKGEYAYTDDYGILCRLDIKQGQRTKVTEKTTDVLIIIQGHKDLPKDKLQEAMELLDEGISLIQQ